MKKKLKIICVGDSGVGKTRFLSIMCNRTTDYYYNPTIGVDFKSNNLIICHEYNINYWDLSGNRRFECIIKNYFNNGDIVALFFNYNDIKSIKNINYWIALVRKYNLTIGIKLIGTDYKEELSDNIQELNKYSHLKIYNLKKFSVFKCEYLIKNIINDMENDNYKFEKYVKIKFSKKKHNRNNCWCCFTFC